MLDAPVFLIRIIYIVYFPLRVRFTVVFWVLVSQVVSESEWEEFHHSLIFCLGPIASFILVVLGNGPCYSALFVA